MPTVEQLTVAFDNAISGGAQAAAADLERLAAAVEKTGQASAATDQVIRRSGPTLDAIAAKTDGAVAATNRLEAAERRYQAAVSRVMTSAQAGNTSPQQAAQMIERLGVLRDQDAAKAKAYGEQIEQRFAPATAATKELGASAGQTSFALRQLGVQSIQAFSGIATGQSVMQVAIQQGHQVADVALSTGTGFSILGTAAKAVAGAVFSIPGAAVAAGAAIIAMGAASESSERRLHTLQNQLRATRDDYKSMAAEVQAAARGVSSTSGIGTSDARTAAQTIGSAPDFHGSQAQLQGLVKTAGDMAAVFGTSVPDAAKELAAALKDPAAEADKLAKSGFPGMTQAMADSIEIMARGGDRAGAFAQDLRVLQNGTKGSNDNLTDFQKALHDLGTAFDRTDGQGDSFVKTLGHGIMEAAAVAVEALAGVVHGIEAIWEAASRHPDASTARSPLSVPRDTSERQPLLGPLQADGQRAVGLMQINPKTAAGLGYSPADIATTGGNIAAAVAYIEQLFVAGHGQWDATLAQYGGYGKNVGAAAGYIGKLNSADIHSLSPDIAAAIQRETQRRGLPADFTTHLEQIAMVESGGHQFAGAPQVTTHAPEPDRRDPTRSAIPQSVSSQSTLDDALTLAKSIGAPGSPDSSFQKAYDNLKQLRAGLAALGPETTQNATQWDELTNAISATQKAMYDAVPAASRLVETNEKQIADTKALTDAYLKGGDAVMRVTAAQKAYQQALGAGLVPGTAKFSEALPSLTDQNLRGLQGEGQQQLAQQTDGQRDQIAYIKAETDSLGANDNARTLYLAHIKAEQDALRVTHDLNSHAAQDYIANSDAIAAATQAYQNQKAALDTVSADISRAFNTMSDSITQAFVSGQGHAVNFGNIMKGVAEQIVSEFLKLAVINPLLNSILGQNNVTLSGAISAIGGGSAGGVAGVAGASGGGLGGLLGPASSVYSLASNTGILSSLGLGNIGQSLGLSGIANSLGLGGIGSTIGGILGTQLVPVSGIATNTALAGMGGAFGPETIGSYTAAGGSSAAGLTLGGLLGGVGAGSALGGLEGYLFGPGTKQSQVLGTVGSLGGAGAGAAIGSIIPGIGTLIGGLIGGALGGLGGVFGPGPINPYSRIPITTSNGQIVVGDASSQGLDQRAVNDSLVQTQTEAANINALLKANGLAISNQIGVVQIGQNSPKGYQDPTKYGSLDAAFSNYQFMPTAAAANDNPVLANGLARGLSGQTFASASDLTSRIAAIQQFIGQTLPALANYGTPQGSLVQTQQQIGNDFAAAIQKAGALNQDISGIPALEQAAMAKAQQDADRSAGDLLAGNQGTYLQARSQVTGSSADAENAKLGVFDQSASDQRYQLDQQLVGIYGAAYRSTTTYATQVTTLDQSLAEQRLAIQKQYDDQSIQQAHQTADTLAGNRLGYQAATAQLSGDPAQIEAAKLAQFDQSTVDQKFQLDQQLTSIYGVGYRTSVDYANQMAALEQNLGAQRLLIQKQYNDQMLSTADGVIASLAQYAHGLQFGADSPLRPQAQYGLASSQFSAVSGAALAGDFTSLQQLQSYASTFLSASRSVNGSGQQYVADFDKVMSVLAQVGSLPTDTLTADVYTSETRTQTDTLSMHLQDIVAAINALKDKMGAASNMPSRIAA